MRRFAWGLLLVGLAFAQSPQPDGAGVERGVAPAVWPPSGPHCMEVPDWRVHEYNADLYLVRQSGCLDFEKPFVFLLFGKERALLLDTGSRNFPAAAMLENVVGKWLHRNGRSHLEVVAVHTHEHEDHVAGDKALLAMTSSSIRVKLVPATVDAAKAEFNIRSWPEQTGTIDLGRRLVDVIPIPGHSAASVAFYDRQTGVLFTGDTLYPGRLYVNDWGAFHQSVQRLVTFTEGKIVSQVLGNHIEQSTTAYLDYAVGTIYQPEEHALALSRGDLLALLDALNGLHQPTRLALRDFTIWPHTDDAQAEKRFEQHRQEQLQRMWDQGAP